MTQKNCCYHGSHALDQRRRVVFVLGGHRVGESLGQCGVNSDWGLLCVGECAGWMTSQSPFWPDSSNLILNKGSGIERDRK